MIYFIIELDGNLTVQVKDHSNTHIRMAFGDDWRSMYRSANALAKAGYHWGSGEVQHIQDYINMRGKAEHEAKQAAENA